MGYFEDEGINFSTLKFMGESPRAYMRARIAGTPESAAFQFGRLVHMLALEPENAAAHYAVTTLASRRGKAWEDQCSKAAKDGREVVLARDWSHANRCAQSIMDHPVAGPMIMHPNKRTEHPIYWKAGACPYRMKSKLDLLVPGVLLADVKTTSEIRVEKWMSRAASYDYLAQFAMYHDAWEFASKERLPFYAIVVESADIYTGDRDEHIEEDLFQPDVFVSQISPDDLDYGRMIYQGWLERLEECSRNDHFPGVAEEEPIPFRRPAWCVPPMGRITMGGQPLEL